MNSEDTEKKTIQGDERQYLMLKDAWLGFMAKIDYLKSEAGKLDSERQPHK